MPDQNKQLALSFLDHAFGNRIDEAMACLDVDATWWVLGDPDRLKVSGFRPRLKIERLLQGVKRSMPGGMQHTVHGVTAEGDRVAIEIEAQGLFANGTPYHNRYHFLIEIRNGLIGAIREYMDTLHVHDVSQPAPSGA